MNPFLKTLVLAFLANLYSCQTVVEDTKQTSQQSGINPPKTINDTIKTDSVSTSIPLSPKATPTSSDNQKKTHKPKTISSSDHSHQNSPNNLYHWLEHYNAKDALEKQIPVPAGYQRIPSNSNDFGTWLKGLPLSPPNSKVLLYNGTEKPYQTGAYRVVNIDIGKRDLQQCADAIMRLKAEYHYSQQDYNAIHFNYTSGHTIRFSDWSRGKKPKINGSKVSFSNPSGTNNTSYRNFKKYLTNVYCYAGTASLAKELKPKAVDNIAPGDVFIWGGFPGHAVLVVDVAQHPTTGKKIFLIAQSYMPAQSIHILKNLNNEELSPWYSEDFGTELNTPEWTFDRNTLKTF